MQHNGTKGVWSVSVQVIGHIEPITCIALGQHVSGATVHSRRSHMRREQRVWASLGVQHRLVMSTPPPQSGWIKMTIQKVSFKGRNTVTTVTVWLPTHSHIHASGSHSYINSAPLQVHNSPARSRLPPRSARQRRRHVAVLVVMKGQFYQLFSNNDPLFAKTVDFGDEHHGVHRKNRVVRGHVGRGRWWLMPSAAR